MKTLRIGLALTGSYCTYDKALAALDTLARRYDVTALMSENAYATDTRFGDAAGFVRRLEALTGRPVLHTVAETEPVGPNELFDVLAVAPCTGNTAAMAVKSQLRSGKPVVLAFGSNDGLGVSARNIGELLNRKNIYFVPMYQDDPVKKPRSLASDYCRLEETILAACEGRQIEPILACPL